MLLKEVPEAEDGALVGHRVLAKVNSREAPHGLAVEDGVFSLRVREIEPLLQKVDAEHPLEAQWRPSLAVTREVRFDESDERLPWASISERNCSRRVTLPLACHASLAKVRGQARLFALESGFGCVCLTSVAHQT